VLPLATLDVNAENMVVRTNTVISQIKLTSYIRPKMTYSWKVSFENEITGLTNVLEQCASLTYYQAYKLRKILGHVIEYNTHLYLMQNNQIQLVSIQNKAILEQKFTSSETTLTIPTETRPYSPTTSTTSALYPFYHQTNLSLPT